jgi:hypothetical protein
MKPCHPVWVYRSSNQARNQPWAGPRTKVALSDLRVRGNTRRCTRQGTPSTKRADGRPRPLARTEVCGPVLPYNPMVLVRRRRPWNRAKQTQSTQRMPGSKTLVCIILLQRGHRTGCAGAPTHLSRPQTGRPEQARPPRDRRPNRGPKGQEKQRAPKPGPQHA